MFLKIKICLSMSQNILEKTLANEKSEMKKSKRSLTSAVVRFCGDSGDGMQLTGIQFSNAASVLGNDIMTFPDFPAEIRAPLGSLAGVSGYQVHFSETDIHTPGDEVDMLVAMNPAALKTNIKDLRRGGTLIINENSFDERNLKKALYDSNPLEGKEGEVLSSKYIIHRAPITQLTIECLKEYKDLSRSEAERCKNFFALGLSYWMFDRELEYSLKWIKEKFKKKELFSKVNEIALRAGYNYAETSELFSYQYSINKVKLNPGHYRNINGAMALVLGLLTASQKANLPLFYAGYPITPASDILHEIVKLRNFFNIKSFQAEDEIAAVAAAIGASYGGSIGVTASSGPGILLKGEAINLAVMTELPLVIINAQRGGPSTGLPTKTEQTDLLLSLFGRSGESPLVVLAPATPSDSFEIIIEAVRIALQFMTPVFVLTDLYLIMGTEPWQIPDLNKIKELPNNLYTDTKDLKDGGKFNVYERDAINHARRWVVPGTKDLYHRIGGLEKDSLTGNVSYDPENHEKMVKTRANKISNISSFIPNQVVEGDVDAKLLVLSWGSTYGVIKEAVINVKKQNYKVAYTQLRYINPLPANLLSILKCYERILIPELNMGQLSFYLRATFGINFDQLNKVKGKPFLVSEIQNKILEIIATL